MMANENVDKIIQRTYRYFYRDGLVELLTGTLFGIIGGALLLVHLGEGTRFLPLFGAILAVMVVGLAFGSKRLLEWLKQRVTYPRTGYVSYRPGEPSIGRWVPIVGATALIVASLFLPEWFNSMSVMEGGLLAMILMFIAYRVNLTRLYVVGFLAAVIGIVVARLQIGDIAGTAVTFGAIGVLLIISGSLTLLRYLTNNSLPEGHHD